MHFDKIVVRLYFLWGSWVYYSREWGDCWPLPLYFLLGKQTVKEWLCYFMKDLKKLELITTNFCFQFFMNPNFIWICTHGTLQIVNGHILPLTYATQQKNKIQSNNLPCMWRWLTSIANLKADQVVEPVEQKDLQ